MPEAPNINSPDAKPATSATLFGVPIGDLGWFASLLMGTATGFAAFFAGTFLGIVSLLMYNSVSPHAIDYAYAYKRVGLPLGSLALLTAYVYLAVLWTRRQLRRG